MAGQDKPLFGLSTPLLVTLFSALLLFAGTINNYTFAVFFKPMAETFNWDRGPLSGVFFVRNVSAAAFSLPVGYWADRFGPRKVIIPGIAIIGISTVALSLVSSLWHVYLLWGVVIGMAQAGQYVALFSMVMRWHPGKPGMALGIVAGGGGLSAVVAPPVAAKLIEAMDWRKAIAVLGLIVLAIALASAYFVKRPPSESGTDVSQGASKPVPKKVASPLETLRSILGLLRDRELLLIAISSFFYWAAAMEVITHVVNYITDVGISAVSAAAMVGLAGLVGFISRIALGALSDAAGARRDMILCFVLATVSSLALMQKGTFSLWAWAVLFGIAMGGGTALIPLMVGQYFGNQRLATRLGVVMIGGNLGGAFGPVIGGATFDMSGGYGWAWVTAAACTGVAAIAALMVPPLRTYVSRRTDSANE